MEKGTNLDILQSHPKRGYLLEVKTEAKDMAWKVLFIVCLVVLFAQTPNTQGDYQTNHQIQTTYAPENQAQAIELFRAPLIVASASVNDSRINPGQSITFSGILYYQGTTTPPGAGNSALRFDGVDNYVDLGDALDLGNVSFTIESWFKLVGSPTYRTIVAKGHFGFGAMYSCLADTTGKFRAYLDDGTNGVDILGVTDVFGGEWHHGVLVRDKGAGKVILYLDGAFENDALDVTDDLSNVYPLRIGTTAASVYYMNGIIDEVRIYKRVLSGQEISEHYQGIYSDETGLVLHLNFDGNTQDSSGQGNHGTFYRATWTNGYANININIELGGTLKKTVALVNSTNGAFTISSVIGENNVGIYNYNIYAIDTTGQNTVQNQTIPVIVDKLKITLSVMDDRIDVGSTLGHAWTGVYEYDGTVFEGSIILNDTLTKDDVGKYGYEVANIIDPVYNLTTFTTNSFYIIFDRVNITISISDDHINIGDSASLAWIGVYQYDGTTFAGSITYNDTLIKNTVGKYGYTIQNISDPISRLNTFTSNSVYSIWDSIKIVEGGVTQSSAYLGETETFWFKAVFEFDNVKFDETKGTLYLNESAMKWSTNNDRWEYTYTTDLPGAKTFKVTGVFDTQYGLTAINDVVGAQTITWKLKPKPFFETPRGIATLGGIAIALLICFYVTMRVRVVRKLLKGWLKP